MFRQNRPVMCVLMFVLRTTLTVFLMSISACHWTGAKNSLVIEQNPGALTAEQIQQSLSKLSLLKIHPRDEQINQAFIARLDNLYQLTLAETRDWDKQLLPSFQLSTREAGS
ncbi:putative chaperone protein [Escherichia coli]|nr:putative chaperone protein [Escherichia coli]